MEGVQRSLSIPEPEMRILNQPNSSGLVGSTTSVIVQHGKSDHVKSALDLSKQLQTLMLKLKGSVIAADGKAVNYDNFKSNKLFSIYEEQTKDLRNVDLTKLNDIQKTVFFINIYNALTIHALAHVEKLPQSVLNIQLFWRKTAYNLGGYIFSLDDIEHGILRGNRPHPGGRLPFKEGDARLQFMIKKFDPRIHFALVCGAKSCPAIQVYSEENLERALDSAARSFCDENVRCRPITKEILISQLFQWYRLDFGSNDVDAIRWTLPYLMDKKRQEVSILLDLLERQGMVDIIYVDWDWTLNKM